MEVSEAQGNDQQEGTQAEVTNQNDPQSYELAGWTAGFPAELKEQYGAELAKYPKMGDFARVAFEAQDKLSRAIVRPGEDASEEEVAAYREAIGVPADPNGYELKAEGSGTEVFLESLKELAHKNNLSTTQAQAMVDYFVQTEQKAKEALEVELKNTIENGIKELRSEMGSSFEPKMLQAQRMVAGHFGEEFSDYLKESQLGNDPRFIKGMIALSDLISEDNLDTPPGGGQGGDGGYPFPNTPGW